MKNLILLSSALLLSLSTAFAQNYSIDWFTIDGGGGTSSGGSYTLSGTIGQPDAGRLTGGSYTLDGGFWSVAVAIQTPGAPLLSIVRSGNSFIVSWPVPADGFRLEENGNLSLTNAWAIAPLSYSTNNNMISVNVPSDPGSHFYRLRK